MNQISSSKKTNSSFFSLKNPILWAFIISILYWTYLSFASSMQIRFDGQAYQDCGTVIYREGISAYLKLDSSNVILYPLVISLSMHIAEFFGTSHFFIQTWIQIFFLFLAQILIFIILKRLRINKFLAALTILYFGLSPALVNATFSSWSEVISFPLVTGIIYASSYSWKAIQESNFLKIVRIGIILSILFIAVTLVREVYEYVFKLFIVSYFLLSVRFLFRKQIRTFVYGCSFLLILVFLNTLALTPYKMANLKYNGYESLVLKGGASLAGNAAARSQKLTNRQLLSFLAYVPGENVVKKFFGEDAFHFWRHEQYNKGHQIKRDLASQGVPVEQMDATLYKKGIGSVLSNPLQYIFLTTAEGFKMLFWESTKIGFVSYPPWLSKLFNFGLFKDSLRLLMFLLTFAGLLFTIVFTCRHNAKLYDDIQANDTQNLSLLTSMLIIILSNIALHAPFIIETRYGLPVASLYLVLIAFSIQKIFLEKK